MFFLTVFLTRPVKEFVRVNPGTFIIFQKAYRDGRNLGVQSSIRFKYISYILFFHRQLCSCPDAWTGKEKSENTETGDKKGTDIQERFFEEEDKTMSDLKQYIDRRKKRDAEFTEGYEEGYEQFKIGVMLRQVRESAGLTQEELALRLNTRKTAISRIENHAEDIKLSTKK
jgi:DNA-binding XRE family transcriptional regulator